ncbi:MAG TPA: hypothetical protein ENI82_02505 [Bacteroidetes bacterium]|nr:hypothetical protein [Bacteroidota bacterium]
MNFIFIGVPKLRFQKLRGTSPQLQLGDKFADIEEIPLFLEKHRIKVPEKQRAMIISSLKIDRDVTMGIVADVKDQLRKSGQLKVNYSAKKRAGNRYN